MSIADEIGLGQVLGKNRYYLYARTRTALIHAADELDDLAGALNRYVYVLCPFGRVESWRNGFVLRIHGAETLAELAELLSPPLERFDAWAIHDGIGEARESPGHGLVARFFLEATRQGKPLETAQLFLTFSDKETDPDAAAAALSSGLKGLMLPAFHFADGRIIMLRTSEPARSILRRSEKQIARLHCLSIVDSGLGEAISIKEFDNIWEMVNLYDDTLRFEEEESGEATAGDAG